MNQQGHLAAQTTVRPNNVGGPPFYPPSHPRNGPARLNAPLPTGFSQPTLTAPVGSTLLPPGQQSQMYTLVYNVTNNNRNIQNSTPAAGQYTQAYTGQGKNFYANSAAEPMATYQNTPIYFATPPINQYPTTVAYPPVQGWSLPQQTIPYNQQAPVFQSAAAPSTLLQQPPPTISQPQQQTVTLPKRERHPLAIVDPQTNKNVLEDEVEIKKLKEESGRESVASSGYAHQSAPRLSSGAIPPYQQPQFTVQPPGQVVVQPPQQQLSHQHHQHYHSTNAHYQQSNQQPPLPHQVGVSQQQQQQQNYQNVQNYQKSGSDDQSNSQTNSRGQTPLSGTHTPTDSGQLNYSPGPPPAPNITTKNTTGTQQQPTDQASQVYCELALNIARQVTATGTTPPPPASSSSSENLANMQSNSNSNSAFASQQDSNTSSLNDTPTSSHASVTLQDKQQSSIVASSKVGTGAVVTTTTTTTYSYSNSVSSSGKSFAAATAREPKPRDILNQSNPELGVEKADVDVTFGFFDPATDDSTLSKDDSTTSLPRSPVNDIGITPIIDDSSLPTSMSTPIKEDRKVIEPVPEIELPSNDVAPTVLLSKPSPTGGRQLNNEPVGIDGPDTSIDQIPKSSDVTDTSVEEGELRDSEEDAKNQPGALFEKEINHLRAIRTADMWSVDNPNGKKVYSREYMYAVRELPMSKESPDFPKRSTWLPEMNNDLVQARRGPAASSPRDSKARGGNMGAVGGNPPFHVAWQIPSPMQKPVKYPGRGSQRGSGGGSRGSQQKQQQQQMVIPRPSFNADVQLKKAENAWKPVRQQNTTDDPEVAKSEELYRKIKSILNKITPQTFDELSNDFLALEPLMNTPERKMGVIDILFQKVCDEPNFCETYGHLCELLSKKTTQTESKKTESFRYQLLTKCQKNFEDDKNTERLKEEKLKEIESAETEELKAKLKDDLEETLIKHKWRTLGSMRFVGELYKRKLLTKFIAQICVQQLLMKSSDDESVECLCKLMTTIGKTLEEDTTASKLDAAGTLHNMQSYMDKLKEIMEAGHLSKRIQFEIRNLLELRENKWIPRRKEAGPKRIDEIHKEAKLEEVQQQIDIQAHHERQKQQQQFTGRGSQQASRGQQQRLTTGRGSYGPSEDDYNRQRGTGGGQRGGPGGRGDRDRDQDRDNRMSKDKAARAAAASAVGPQDTRYIAEKPLSKHLQSDFTLAPTRSFRKPTNTAATSSKNRFSQLDDRGSAPSSRESSQTRATPSDRQAALEAVAKLTRQPASVEPTESSDQAERDEKPDFTEEKLKRLTSDTFEEFVVSGVYEEVERFVVERKRYIGDMLQIWLEAVLEKSPKERAKLGELLGCLLSKNVVQLTDVADGFDQFVQMAVEADMETDIPLLWPYLGEILGAVLNNRGPGGYVTLRLNDFQKAFKSAGCKSQDLLAHTLLTVQSGSSEQNLQDVWSCERWQTYDFNNAGEVDIFLNKHKLNCLSSYVPHSSSTSLEHSSTGGINSIDPKLVELERHVKSMNPVNSEQLIDWIETNLTDKSSDEFVRALTRSLCSKVFVEVGENDYSLNDEQFESCCNVFRRFITARQNLEVTLLLELAVYYYDRGCPRESLATIFLILSENQVVSRESFEEWWRTEGQLNKHGMILRSSQINRFMESQRSNGDSSDESESTTAIPASSAAVEVPAVTGVESESGAFNVSRNIDDH